VELTSAEVAQFDKGALLRVDEARPGAPEKAGEGTLDGAGLWGRNTRSAYSMRTLSTMRRSQAATAVAGTMRLRIREPVEGPSRGGHVAARSKAATAAWSTAGAPRAIGPLGWISRKCVVCVGAAPAQPQQRWAMDVAEYQAASTLTRTHFCPRQNGRSKGPKAGPSAKPQWRKRHALCSHKDGPSKPPPPESPCTAAASPGPRRRRRFPRSGVARWAVHTEAWDPAGGDKASGAWGVFLALERVSCGASSCVARSFLR
jgi:hypothetical protein